MSTNINFDKKLGITGGTGISLPSSAPAWADTTSLLYDGIDDYQDTSTWSTLDGANEFTISLWVKINSLVGTNRLLGGYEIGTASNLYMNVYSNGQMQCWSGGSGSNYTRTNVGAITSGIWHHIVFRLLPTSVEPNRYNRQRIFIDGVVNHNSSNYSNGPIPNGTTLGIGANYNYSNVAFFYPTNGNINEVAIWDSYLTDAQILEVYNNGSANDLKTLPTAPNPTNWYRSENANWVGGSYYSTSDEMGNGAKLLTRNMAEASRVTDVPPNPFTNTKSILLDGVDDIVSLSSRTQNFTDFSVSAWFTAISGGSYKAIFGNSTAVGGYLFAIANSGSAIYFYDNGWRQLSGAVTDGNWHHLIVTYDSSANELKSYVDNSLYTTYTPNASDFPSNSHSFNQIGGRTSVGRWNGNLDELAVWDSVLDSTQVSNIYNGGIPNDLSSTNPVHWWRCGDGDTAPTLTDNGSGGNNGTMTNFSTFSTDVPTASSFTNTKSIALDGVDDFVDCGSVSAINSASTVSVSYWGKKTASNKYLLVGSQMSSTNGLWLIWWNDGNVYFAARNGNIGFASYALSFDTNWHHFIGVYNGSSLKIYIDGILSATSTTSIPSTLSSTAGNDFNIGYLQSQYASGNIDEVSVFNSELSASDVTSIYNSGVPNDLTSLSPVSWWRCGDGDTSPTLTDNGSGGNDGTMTNFSTFSTDVPT